ncbi:DUF1501 domain-containing protein [Fulvivirgaceae bacterium BMA12]|uniref:DUF1501 domain-containing protein n=1 Tax=Agaribacillus aureus TaxID=3051825 RepID=A0ABT8LAU9_9BACT|nr:DUF1501 domain-containing protein [Fulvivirgaceae bacterium BMA12]
MDLYNEAQKRKLEFTTRRHFLKKCGTGLGGIALASLFGSDHLLAKSPAQALSNKALPHFLPKAKRVIYMHMAGAPSQLELFDYKPKLKKLHNLDCPKSLLEGKRFAFIQGTPKMLGPQHDFKQYGESGTYISDILPHFSSIVDDVTIIKSMHTDEFNHAPAQLLLQTGSPRAGRPSIGSWVTYGLGSENENLPGYMVLVSGGNNPSAGKNAWGSGFLPSEYQGVQCRNSGDPILYVSNPDGMSRNIRRKSLDAINAINKSQYEEFGDREILSRISQYEMAFKMQISVPDIMDISKEPEKIQEMYGAEPGKASFANNCLLARRLLEQGVRFIQLYHWGWDMHGDNKNNSVNEGLKKKCGEVDQPMTALVKDLKQRGLLDDTLVIWGGEFGRTPMRENRGGRVMDFYGRDHHSEAFSIWMAGGGIKEGLTYGETDEIGYYGIRDRVHVHDLQATILHQLGVDHEKFTYHFQGRDFRLTDVHGHVVKGILS